MDTTLAMLQMEPIVTKWMTESSPINVSMDNAAYVSFSNLIFSLHENVEYNNKFLFFLACRLRQETWIKG